MTTPLHPLLRLPAAGLLCAAFALAGSLAACGDNNDNGGKKPSRLRQLNVSKTAPQSNPSADAPKEASAKTLDQLPGAKRPKGSSPRIVGVEGKPLPAQVETLTNDVGSFWASAFDAADAKFPNTKFVVSTAPFNSGCGTVAADDAPVYCARDKGLIFPVAWFQKNTEPIGDFATAYVVATTWGFRVEDVVGLSGKLKQDEQTLVASCLAGNWAASVYQRKALEKGDLDEAGQLLAGAGNNGKALANAFLVGFNSGKGAACPGVGS